MTSYIASLGYLVGNYPDSWLLHHYPTGKVLSISEHRRIAQLAADLTYSFLATLIWGTIVITFVD